MCAVSLLQVAVVAVEDRHVSHGDHSSTTKIPSTLQQMNTSPSYLPSIRLSATNKRFDLHVDGSLDPVEREMVYELWDALPIPRGHHVVTHGSDDSLHIHQIIDPPFQDLNRLVTQWTRPSWASAGFLSLGYYKAEWGGPFMTYGPYHYNLASRKLKTRKRWKRMRTISKVNYTLRSWNMDAARRTYAPGGAGYEAAHASFKRTARCQGSRKRCRSRQ